MKRMLCRSACTCWGIVCECDPLHLPQSEAHLQRAEAVLGRSSGNLEPSWAIWSQFEAVLGPSWADLGAFLGLSRALLAPLKP